MSRANWTLFDFELRGYQHYLKRKCWKHMALCHAVDMGLGKTAAVLSYLEEVEEREPGLRVLVIGPKKVASKTWPNEIKRWRHLRRLTCSVMVGEPAVRSKALRQKTFIHTINKENLHWLWAELKEGSVWPYDILVIDEASMLKEGRKRIHRKKPKTADAVRDKLREQLGQGPRKKKAPTSGKGSRPPSRFGIICKMSALCSQVIEMTGTPCPEGLHNLWGLTYVLDKGERLGTSRTAFEKRWFDKGYMGWAMDPKPNAKEEITGRISDIFFSLRAEDHLELPKEITTPETDIWVDLPKDIMAEYRRFERDLFTKRYDVEAVTSGALVNKLLQFANGSIYRGDGQYVHVHDLKLDALEETIESLDRRPVIVVYSFKFDKERIRKRFGKRVRFVNEESDDIIDDWNEGKVPIMCTHPGSISHGTNIQFGGNNLIYYGVPHSGEGYKQMNARLVRDGQPEPHVFIRHILARNTWDERVLLNQFSKDGVERAVRNEVRVRRQEVIRELRLAA